jgi:hypothetical protein
VAHAFVWALPQVLRDGFVHFETEDEMDAFDDVLFPLAQGRQAEVAPEVSSTSVTTAGGREKRNPESAEARTRYDVGPGLRSDADIMELLAFFRARMGPARGFRLRDPFDCVAVSASFVFDVPVRFAEDRLSVSRATFLAGAAPSVPLVEIRE